MLVIISSPILYLILIVAFVGKLKKKISNINHKFLKLNIRLFIYDISYIWNTKFCKRNYS